MRVVLAGLWYPMAILRYYHKALQAFDGVEIVTAGPSSGASIPWGREYCYPDHAFYPDFEPWQKGPREAAAAVADWVRGGEFGDVDLWIDVDAGYFTDCEMPWPHVIVATDSHCLNYDRQREVADYFFNMHRAYCQDGDIPLPYCYSEFDHYPEAVEQKYDVTVLGLQYADRIAIAQVLANEGLRVYRKLGDIWDDYRRSLCSAPICFTWSSRQDLIARVFEGLATRRLVITNRVPDLKRFFREGEQLIAFSTHQEATEAVLYYAAHPDEAVAIAEQGYRAAQGHTYTNRLLDVFETVGIDCCAGSET